MRLFRQLPLIAVPLLLAACGSGTPNGQDASTDANPQLGAANTANTGAEVGSLNPQPYAESVTTVDAGDREPGASITETEALVVSPQFDFPTASRAVANIDWEAARGTTMSVLLCTDYERQFDSYRVDYTSCLLEADMVDGRLSESFLLPNQYSSVLAVAWPQTADSGMPLYMELPKEALTPNG